MKLRQLEMTLQQASGFENPKIHLEQYTTPAHLAACLLHTAHSKYDDIDGKTVLDVGCGGGILSIGASLLGASYTLGVDIDEEALDIFQKNMDILEPTDVVDCVKGNVKHLLSCPMFKGHFDTIIMNPPFGTKNNKGIDMEFLQVAAGLCVNAIYSLHKTATRQFICKKARTLGLNPTVIAELRYNLDASYSFHKSKSKDIEVDLVRFTPIKHVNR